MSTPTPQPIADWLDKLGVGQYAQHFVENEIDVPVLRHLTDQEGRDMRPLVRRHHSCYPSVNSGFTSRNS